MLVVAAGFVVLVIAVAVLGSAARERPTLVTTVPIIGGVVVVLVVLVLLGLLVARGSSAPDEAAKPSSVKPIAETPKSEPAPRAQQSTRPRPLDLLIDPRVDPDGFGSTTPALGDLPDASTKLIAIAVDHSVVLQQCEVGGACSAGVPAGNVGPIAMGLVELQRILRLPAGDVDCQVRRCALIATFPGTSKIAGSAALVFGRPVDVPSLRVDPARHVRRDQLIDVEVRDLQPSERVTVTWCVPPGPVEPQACGRPAPAVPVDANGDGLAHAQLRLPTGENGPRNHRCDPRSRCAIAIVGSTIATQAVEVTFAGVSGPDLPTGKLVGGLAGAAVLAIIALWLTRRRAGEALDDPFWGVSLDVPEWEGVDLTVEL